MLHAIARILYNNIWTALIQLQDFNHLFPYWCVLFLGLKHHCVIFKLCNILLHYTFLYLYFVCFLYFLSNNIMSFIIYYSSHTFLYLRKPALMYQSYRYYVNILHIFSMKNIRIPAVLLPHTYYGILFYSHAYFLVISLSLSPVYSYFL